MACETGRFRRTDRILSSREFARAVKTGKRSSSGSFVVAIAPAPEASDAERRRLGVTVSKRVGNAVVRNRLKRCIREWFRAARGSLPGGSDVVIIARPAASELSSREVGAVLDRMTRVPQLRKARATVAGF